MWIFKFQKKREKSKSHFLEDFYTFYMSITIKIAKKTTAKICKKVWFDTEEKAMGNMIKKEKIIFNKNPEIYFT